MRIPRLDICLTLSIIVCMTPRGALQADDTELNSRGPDFVVESKRPTNQSALATEPYGLTRHDLDVLAETLPENVTICPTRTIRAEVRVDDRNLTTHLVGTSPEFQIVHGLGISRGRFLTNEDLRWKRNVAVMGEQQALQLFLDRDPIGQSIRVGQHYYLIVGLIKQPLKWGRDNRADIYIPITTMHSRHGDQDIQRRSGSFYFQQFELSSIEFLLTQKEDVPAVSKAVLQVLDSLHDDDSYTILIPSTPVEEVAP